MEILSDNRLLLGLAAAVVLFIVYLLSRSPGKAASAGGGVTQAAVLEDMDRSTGQQHYELSAKTGALFSRNKGQHKNLHCVTIPMPTVGRQHALIQYVGGDYYLTDKGSRNGSFVNGVRVTEKQTLRHGDVVRIYKYAFRFLLPQQTDDEATQLATEAEEATQLATPPEPILPGAAEPSPPPAAAQAESMPAVDVDFVLEDADVTLENFIDDASIVSGRSGPGRSKKR